MYRSLSLVIAASSAAACIGNGDPHDHSIVRVDQEPEGTNCKYGGSAIHTGTDTNHDDILQDAEISSSEYICDAASSVKCIDGEMNIPGPVSLSTSSDFAQLAGVNCIDGDLMIIGSDLAALPSLPDLRIVTGSAIVAGNSNLESLSGLPSLREVGRKYVVQGNDSMTDIGALGGLRRFQAIGIIGNDSLVDLSGLETFTEIEGGIQIANNSSLTSLHGLDNLTRGTREGILIRSNRNLTSLDALAKLQSAVLLEISGNASITSLPLQQLQKVDVYLMIKDNANLATVELPALVTTGGLVVLTNPALTTVHTPSLVLAGAVDFQSNTTLASIRAPKLSYTTVDFNLVNMPQLAQADFSSLVAIGGPLYMYQLPQLSTFGGFAKLGSIGGNFTLRQCNGLADFAGLTSLVDVADMTVTENAQLTSFTGLDSFSKVGGNLWILDNPNVPVSVAQAFASAITVVGTTTIN